MSQFDMLDNSVLGKVFHNPVFILSAPRSGSTLLFELLSQSPDFYTIGGESHPIYAQFPHLKMENEDYDSGRLFEHHADEVTTKKFRSMMASMLVDRGGVRLQSYNDLRRINVLEKTPRNALNLPFLLKVFPKAKFIFLYRDPRQNISSIIEAWDTGLKTGRFVTFADLPGWDLKKWCLLLPPGWRELNGKPLVDIAAFQWLSCNKIVLDQLDGIDNSRWLSVSYNKLLANPLKQITRVCKFANVKCDAKLKGMLKSKLPLSTTVVSEPQADKWRRHEKEIRPFLSVLRDAFEKLVSLPR